MTRILAILTATTLSAAPALADTASGEPIISPDPLVENGTAMNSPVTGTDAVAVQEAYATEQTEGLTGWSLRPVEVFEGGGTDVASNLNVFKGMQRP